MVTAGDTALTGMNPLHDRGSCSDDCAQRCRADARCLCRRVRKLRRCCTYGQGTLRYRSRRKPGTCDCPGLYSVLQDSRRRARPEGTPVTKTLAFLPRCCGLMKRITPDISATWRTPLIRSPKANRSSETAFIPCSPTSYVYLSPWCWSCRSSPRSSSDMAWRGSSRGEVLQGVTEKPAAVGMDSCQERRRILSRLMR